MLFHAVGVQEGTGDIYNGVAVPGHGQAALAGDGSHHGGLQVLLGGQLHEAGGILGLDDHGHPLLGLTDGQLGAVQALVLLGYFVQVDVQALGQLADGDGHAAGAEVVAALDEAGGLGVAEQALELALLRGVALLDFGPAGLQRLGGVGLGGTGGAAAAVAPGPAAQQDHKVARLGTLAADVGGRGRGNDRADLHALGRIAGVIELIHLAGGQADLVAVGAVACGGLGDDGALGQLAGHGLLNGLEGVGSTGHTHGGVDIGPAGQGVTDGPAHAGGRAAERLDLGGVVVGLVLEQQEPVLLAAVGIDLDLHGAGVDLFGLIQFAQLALLFQELGDDGADVHEVDGLGSVELLSRGQIVLIGLLEDGAGKLHAVDGGVEGGVAAVVGPIGVDDPQLGHGGVAVLGLEVVAAEAQVVHVHGQAVIGHHLLQPSLIQGPEAGQGGDGLRDVVGHGQGGEGFQGSLPCLDGVDEVLFDRPHFLGGERTV